MKRSVLIILLILISYYVQSQVLEDLRIKGDYTERPLHLVLLDLELNYRLNFQCNKDQLRQYKITTSFRRAHFSEVMTTLLQGTDLSYKIVSNRTIEIFQKNPLEQAVVKSDKPPSRYDFTISGLVMDAESGERLPFANVSVYGTAIGNVTNTDGYFTIFHVPVDTAILVVDYLGYQQTYLRLQPDFEMSDLKIQIRGGGVNLETVVVQAGKEEQMIKASVGVSSVGLTPMAMSSLPSYGEKDIFRSLQLLPGISGTNESSSGLYVRGGTPDQNLILLDGFTVYHVDHLFGFFSAFNSNAIKDIQLHKGGFGAMFGGRLSSVVEMTGKDGNTEQFNAGAGLSLLSYNGYIEAPFSNGKGSLIVTARRSFQSKFYSNLFDSFTGISGNNQIPGRGRGPGGGGFQGFGQLQIQPNSFFYDLNSKLTYRQGKKDIFSLSFYNGEDDLDNSRLTDNSIFRGGFGGGNSNFNFNSDNIDLSNWGNIGGSVKWSRKWSDLFYSKLTSSYSNYFSTRDRRNQTTVIREDSTSVRNIGSYENNDLRDYTIKFDNELKLTANQQLDFGIHSTYNDIVYDFTQNDTTRVISRHNQGISTSAYLQDKISLFDKYIFNAGLRGSHYSITNKLYLEPRASLIYLASDQIKVKAAYGKYYQFVSRIVREDIQQGSRDFWVLADDDKIPIGSSQHYIAGISHESTSWLFDIEAYYKELNGLSEYSTRITPQGFGPGRGGAINYEEFFYTGTGNARGIEFLIQKKAGDFNGWISYTLGQVKYDFPAFGEEPFYASQDQRHELKLIGNYKLGRWNFSGTLIYATGRPYTAPTGYYEIELIDGNYEGFFEVSSKNGLRLPDYHRLDLSATYRFFLGSSRVSAGLSLINVYNRSNIWYKEYEVVEGELFETNISLIDFTPSFFVTWDLK